MSFDAALVREQGVTFAVVVVKNHAVSSDSSRRQAMTTFGAHFPGVPIVLMVQDGGGRPTYWGRPDIAVPREGPGQRAPVETILLTSSALGHRLISG